MSIPRTQYHQSATWYR